MAVTICRGSFGSNDRQRYPDRQWFGNIPDYPVFRDEQGRPLVDEMVRMAWFGTGCAGDRYMEGRLGVHVVLSGREGAVDRFVP